MLIAAKLSLGLNADMSASSTHPSRRDFLGRLTEAGIATALLKSGSLHGQAPATIPGVAPAPETVITFPGAWQFHIPRGSIILVSDQQLLDLTDPDKEVDLSLTGTPNKTTLRKLCQERAAAGARTIILAFDEFWSQYRVGQGGKPRQWTPDTEGYLQHITRIGQTLREYGLGLELSLLSPLEIGPGYARATGESGRWVQFKEGWRDPATGQYSVGLWEQRRWTNNKGTIELQRRSVRVFAFRERRVGGTANYTVDPADIVELTTSPELEAGSESGKAKHRRLVVRGSGDAAANPRDRVLVVVTYDVPEMDYFSPKALPFLEDLVARYHAAGVPLSGLYADEMHIQQDWGYADHHENGQFALRYLTPHLARRFADLYGPEYADFEKWLVYFCHGQHDFLSNLQARLDARHVLASDADSVHRTHLLRRRYYELLHNTVVELFAQAKHSAEKRYGHHLEARAHATWAQSPTIDFWKAGNQPHAPKQYEYTPDFLWSNTVQQAASACSDYFKWNEFLTGGGNDHAEGGWSDRNYYGLALACSTGSLNDVPNAYAAAWGLPAPAHERHRNLENAFGCSPDPAFAAVFDHAHRQVPVLMLYPSSLVACDERFGSWMVQYGYANYVTPAKLLEHARLLPDGTVDLRGFRYKTIAILFEPLPPPDLLPWLMRFFEAGGRVIWSGPIPRFDLAGQPILDRWKSLFGVRSVPNTPDGIAAPGQSIRFAGRLASVPEQSILTDFTVDQVFPISPEEGVETVARLGVQTLGVHRSRSVGGSTTYLGFRPRDDQAASLGTEVRTWFEILRTLGAYPDPDDPSVISRTSPYLATEFPNGAVCIAAHYRHHVESWPGGFHRDAAKDAEVLAANPLPPDELILESFPISGRKIHYHGRRLVAFRESKGRSLVSFAGYGTDRIRIDDRGHRFASQPVDFIAWAPVPAQRQVPAGARVEIWVHGNAQVYVPWSGPINQPRLVQAGPRPGLAGSPVNSFRAEEGVLRIEAGPGKAQGHLYFIPGQPG